MEVVATVAAFCVVCALLTAHSVVDDLPRAAFCDRCGQAHPMLVMPARD